MLIFIKKHFAQIILIFSAFAFSVWLMFSTFSYKDGTMLIATKAWSDFASHIPLIRSFSFGDNIPPQYPLFSGKPILYHYLFYLLVGVIEKIGFRIDYALDIPSALSFFFLLIVIYLFAKTLFKNRAVGILSVLFFLFNGSLSFLEFFKKHPPSLHVFNAITTSTAFLSFGPYDGKIVSAFWNLNIYTNQRHFALPLALFFLIVFIIMTHEKEKKKLSLRYTIGIGILIGLLSLLHESVFVMSFAVLGILSVILPIQRKSIFFMLFFGILIALPRMFMFKNTGTYPFHIQLGYLVGPPLTLSKFLYYWLMNLGFVFVLFPIGVFFSSSLAKKIFLAFLSVFLIGNLFQFSPEIASNHKFFNVFVILSNMFVAFLLVKLWRLHVATKFFVMFFVVMLTCSGIIDFFPIINDTPIALPDYSKNPSIAWIMQHTHSHAIFFNASYLYDPASMAGRTIFVGWPYFPWSLGYDTNGRGVQQHQILESTSKQTVCALLKANKIDYIEIRNGQSSTDFPQPSYLIPKTFSKVYTDSSGEYVIYEVASSCQ